MFFSLRNRLFIIFTCLLTIPFVLLSIIIPSWFTSMVEEQTQDLTVKTMDQYSYYINSIAMQAEDTGKQVLVNQTTQQWLKLAKDEPPIPKEQAMLLKNQVRNLLSSIMVNNSNGISISLFLKDGTGTWGDNPSLQKMKWFEEYSSKNVRFTVSHIDPYQQSQVMQTVHVNSYILPLFDMNTFIPYGIIKVSFPSALLETAMNKISIGKSGRTYLINPQGESVLQPKIQMPKNVLTQMFAKLKKEKKEKGLIETTFNGEDYFVFYQKQSIGNWYLVSEVTKSELFGKAARLQNNLLFASAVVFLLTILASYLLSSNIVRPLGKLAKAMEFIERGDFSGAKRFMPTIKSYNNEVSYLIKVFDHTIRRLQTLIETEYESNIRRKDAEYKALLLQINPHFMNNTLEIMGGLAAQGKNREVMNVSVYLGRMMRYSLNTQSDVVTLGEELSFIRNYTDILKVRYEEAISIKVEEDPQTKFLPIIKFVLQPLVENAVKYSFTEKKHAAILLKTTLIENKVHIVIEDHGAGMDDAVLSDLMNGEKEDATSVLESSGNSIGLKNVLGRLRIYYGDSFSFQIQSEKHVGTRISLYINIEGSDWHDESRDFR